MRDGVECLLSERLRLKVNRAGSAVDRTWNRKFLGYTFTHHYQPKFKVSPESVNRSKNRLHKELRKARGRNVRSVLAKLQPVRICRVSDYRKCEVKTPFEDLDQWLRRTLHAIYWRRWKRRPKRAGALMRHGIAHVRAWVSVRNGREPWWNAGASPMNQALPTRCFTQLGLISLVQKCLELNRR